MGAARDRAVDAVVATLGPALTPCADYCFDQRAGVNARKQPMGVCGGEDGTGRQAPVLLGDAILLEEDAGLSWTEYLLVSGGRAVLGGSGCGSCLAGVGHKSVAGGS
jgi:hypothetical protein